MPSTKRPHRLLSPVVLRRAIALIQLVVIVVLAVPVCAYDDISVKEKPAVTKKAAASDAQHDSCPCCPDEDEGGTDNCSACSHCSFYAPLTPHIAAAYFTVATPLTSFYRFTLLPDVHLPIFVPPQNLA